MRKQPFKPTHRIRIGTGRNKVYVYVKIAGKVGKKNGQQYYNVIADPDGKITSIPAAPESILEKLQQDEAMEPTKKSASAQDQEQFRRITTWIIAEIGDDDITVSKASDAIFQAFMDINGIPLHFQEWTMERRVRAMKYALKYAAPLRSVKEWGRVE